MEMLAIRIMNFLMTTLPFTFAAANSNGPTAPSFMGKIIGWAAGLGGGIVAIFLIISLVKDGMEFAKGQGSSSIFKIVGKALFLILIIGLIFLAVNYTTLGNMAKTIGDKGINTVNTVINNEIL